MYNLFEKLLEMFKIAGYSFLAIWLFSYITMNGLTEGKDINRHIQDFNNTLNDYILEFTFAVAILEVISAINNGFLKPVFSENNSKQDSKIKELENKIKQLENVLRSRQDK